nr:DNA-directed DNA polymerase [Tanacetum cinerariifolium]
MADNRTMEELLQTLTEGYEEAIVILEINADHFESNEFATIGLSEPYHGFERENPHIHINNFKRITPTLKFSDVPNDVIKLIMFPYSLEEAARVCYDKEPLNSILTWDDLVNKFVNQFFPPSKTTDLKNEISRFTQRFEETFGEASERFKEMLRACPHHGFTELIQIDTFYNGLNENDQDSLNATAGGNLLSKTTREALNIIENKSKVRYSRYKSNVFRMNTNSRENASKMDDRIDKLADQILTLVEIVSKKVVTPATVKAVEESCLTCGGNHAHYNCDATNSNQSSDCVATSTYNQVVPQNHAINHMAPPGFAPVQNSTLPSNTIPNPKGEMKAITNQSGVAYEGPSIPTNPSLKKIVERETEETMDKEQTNFQGSTAHIQPPVVPILEPDVPKTLPKPNIPYPLRLNDQKLCEKATNQMEKFFQIFQDLYFDISFADALVLMPKFASTIKSLLLPKKLGDPDKFLIPCDFSGMDVCHALANLSASTNFMPLSIWKKLSLRELTPTRMTLELADRSITHPKGVSEGIFLKVGKFHFPTDFVVVDFEADPRVPLILWRSFLRTGHALIDGYGEEITLRVNDEVITFNLNQTTRYSSTYHDMSVNRIDVIDVAREEYAQEMLEIEAYLKDKLISPEIDHANCDPKGDICLIEKLLNDDPFQLPPMDLKKGEVAKAKSSIEEPPESELKYLPSHLEYAYLEGADKLPVIIAKDLKDDEKSPLKDYKPTVQSQRRVNPIHEVIKKEVIKLLDAGMIYSISDSPWVSPIHCVPKKGGITIVENENNELIPTRLVTDCIDAFEILKKKLTEAPILVIPDWNLPFELMCDASDFAIGGVSRQRKTKHFQPLHYASKTMTKAQIHYTTTEKEMLDVVYAFEKFRPYLVLSKSIVYTDHSALKYLLSKQDAKSRLLRWVLLLQEFDIIIYDKKGTENLAEKLCLDLRILIRIGQVEVSNRGLKRILKRTVGENHALWLKKLEDALWAFRTAYKTPIGCTPYKLVYRKSCHLPIELEYKAYWALKQVNFDHKTSGDHRKLQLNELNELHDQAYENSLIYKEKTKKIRDSKIKNRIFNVGDRVLLFNSRLKIFLGKLKTRWSGPFIITQVFPYQTIELSQPKGPNFKQAYWSLLSCRDMAMDVSDGYTYPNVDEDWFERYVGLVDRSHDQRNKRTSRVESSLSFDLAWIKH